MYVVYHFYTFSLHTKQIYGYIAYIHYYINNTSLKQYFYFSKESEYVFHHYVKYKTLIKHVRFVIIILYSSR